VGAREKYFVQLVAGFDWQDCLGFVDDERLAEFAPGNAGWLALGVCKLVDFVKRGRANALRLATRRLQMA
jgi:hypothetical protein